MGVRTFEEIRHSIKHRFRKTHPESLVALVFKSANPPTCVKIIRPGHWDEVWPTLQIRLDQKNVTKHGKRSVKSEALVFEPHVFEPSFLTDDGGMYAAIICNAIVNKLLSCIEEEFDRIDPAKGLSASSLAASTARKVVMGDHARKFKLSLNFKDLFRTESQRREWFIMANWYRWNHQKTDLKNRLGEIQDAGYSCAASTLNCIEKKWELKYRSYRAGMGGRGRSKKSSV